MSQWLYLVLKDKVDRLVVCNPTLVAKKQGAKTDFRDALHLAQELRTNHLAEVHHESSHWIELRTLVSGYQNITQEIIRFKNRLKAIFRASAIKTDKARFYRSKERVSELKNDSQNLLLKNSSLKSNILK